MKYEPRSRKNPFTAIRQESANRVLDEYSRVIAKKMGLPPKGSTMGNKALTTKNNVFAASAIESFSAIGPCNFRFDLVGANPQSVACKI